MASKIPPVYVREEGAYGIISDGFTGYIAERRMLKVLQKNFYF